MKEVDDLVKQGYDQADAEKIVDGESPKKFKKANAETDGDLGIDAEGDGGAGGSEDIPGLEL
jgi:hypothetical protein